jgi:hypothetical protein
MKKEVDARINPVMRANIMDITKKIGFGAPSSDIISLLQTPKYSGIL